MTKEPSDFSRLSDAILNEDSIREQLERNALTDLKLAISAEKVANYEHMRYLADSDPAGLNAAGYRNMTNAEAILKAFQDTRKKIEKMIVAFERKYPS